MLGVGGIAKGMWTTLTHFVRKPLTVQYPEERAPLPTGFRGLPHLVYDQETGDAKCVACELCAIACPVDVITIEFHRGADGRKQLDRFDIWSGGCIFCGLCVEACPFDALTMVHNFELAGYTRSQLERDKEHLLVPNDEFNVSNMIRIHGPKEGGKAPPSAWPGAAPGLKRADAAPAAEEVSSGDGQLEPAGSKAE